MIATHPPFGVLVGRQGVPAVAQARFLPQLPRPLAVFLGDLLGIERSGIEVDLSGMGDAAAVAFIGIEGRADEAMLMVVRPDAIRRDAELLQMDTGQPIKRLGVAMSEILSVVRRVGRDVLPEREADGLGAEKAAERIEHAPGYYMLVDEDQSAGRAMRGRRGIEVSQDSAYRVNFGVSGFVS